MKKSVSFIVCFFLSVIIVCAQSTKSFEGIIKYNVSFEDSGLPAMALSMLKGAGMDVYIKEYKQRIDVNMVMQSTSSLIDNKNGSMITLMDVMGQKYLIRMDEAAVKKEQENMPDPEIKYTDETKVIAGYTCKKAIVNIANAGAGLVNAVVFYTDEIPVSAVKPVYKGLKGFPLEYSVDMGGIQMKFVASSVSTENVADDKFDVPKEGYTETTPEALQNELMKQMGGQ